MAKLLVFVPIAALIWTGIAIWRWAVKDIKEAGTDQYI